MTTERFINNRKFFDIMTQTFSNERPTLVAEDSNLGQLVASIRAGPGKHVLNIDVNPDKTEFNVYFNKADELIDVGQLDELMGAYTSTGDISTPGIAEQFRANLRSLMRGGVEKVTASYLVPAEISIFLKLEYKSGAPNAIKEHGVCYGMNPEKFTDAILEIAKELYGLLEIAGECRYQLQNMDYKHPASFEELAEAGITYGNEFYQEPNFDNDFNCFDLVPGCGDLFVDDNHSEHSGDVNDSPYEIVLEYDPNENVFLSERVDIEPVEEEELPDLSNICDQLDSEANRYLNEGRENKSETNAQLVKQYQKVIDQVQHVIERTAQMFPGYNVTLYDPVTEFQRL